MCGISDKLVPGTLSVHTRDCFQLISISIMHLMLAGSDLCYEAAKGRRLAEVI